MLHASETKKISSEDVTQRKNTYQADGRPPCINGDIAIQWEWSNFDPSRNQNPLTDYDKTLHNWLCPRDEHVTQNLCQSTRRERLGKYVKYKALSFLLRFIFPRTRLLKWSVDGFSRGVVQITRNHARKCLFWGLHNGRKHLGGQIPQKRQNWTLICSAERLSCAPMKIDVVEEWRHWRVAALQLKRCQLVFDDHCQTYGNLCQTAVKFQIIVPIHIDLNKIRAHFCARLRP